MSTTVQDRSHVIKRVAFRDKDYIEDYFRMPVEAYLKQTHPGRKVTINGETKYAMVIATIKKTVPTIRQVFWEPKIILPVRCSCPNSDSP